MTRPRLPAWDERIRAATRRIREPLVWLPIPALLGFGPVLLLTAYVLTAVNPRMGQPPDVLVFPGEQAVDRSIWIAVTTRGSDVVVTTNDRQVFRWRADLTDLAPLEPFVSFLKQRVAEENASAAIAGHVSATQTTAVIAADQRLKYLHVRPILYALGAAKISRYSFEIQLPPVAAASEPSHETTPH